MCLTSKIMPTMQNTFQWKSLQLSTFPKYLHCNGNAAQREEAAFSPRPIRPRPGRTLMFPHFKYWMISTAERDQQRLLQLSWQPRLSVDNNSRGRLVTSRYCVGTARPRTYLGGLKIKTHRRLVITERSGRTQTQAFLSHWGVTGAAPTNSKLN